MPVALKWLGTAAYACVPAIGNLRQEFRASLGDVRENRNLTAVRGGHSGCRTGLARCSHSGSLLTAFIVCYSWVINPTTPGMPSYAPPFRDGIKLCHNMGAWSFICFLSLAVAGNIVTVAVTDII